MSVPTEREAFLMGGTGGPPSEGERLAFEAWMRGHSWLLTGEWDGSTYNDRTDRPGWFDHNTMIVRMLWAAWRDRAALEAQGRSDEDILRYAETLDVLDPEGRSPLHNGRWIYRVERNQFDGDDVVDYIDGTNELLAFARYGGQTPPEVQA